MRGKKYLLVLVIALVSLTMVSVPVKASPYVNFFIDESAGPGYIPGPPLDVGEFIYYDKIYPGLTSPRVDAGDIRLSPVNYMGASYAAGSAVAIGDTDYYLPILKTWGLIKHAENIAANAKYDFGEYIYSDKDTSTTVSAGDIRYYPVPGYTLGSTVATDDTDVGTSLIIFYPTTSGKYERFMDILVPNTAYDFAKVLVDIMIDTDIPDNSASGIVGWGLKVIIDPTVLTPVTAVGAQGGYFLAEFAGRWGLETTPLLVPGVGTDSMTPGEMLSPTPTTGAGNQSTYPGEYPAEKLVTLIFSPLSDTAWSKIDLVMAPAGNYMTPDGTWHEVTMIDGNYNPPLTPEFPLGIGFLMALAPLIPIIYLWRKRPKKRV